MISILSKKELYFCIKLFQYRLKLDTKIDAETAKIEFDPFSARKVEHPTKYVNEI